MSPRAAARLETLGFSRVYDYVAGKADCLAAALPTEGQPSKVPTAGDVIRGGDIVCHEGEWLVDSRDRVLAAGSDTCIVVDDRHVVLGRAGGRALAGDPSSRIEDVMQSGPSTVRPDTPLPVVLNRLRSGNVEKTLVTDPEGRLIGSLYLEDVERRLSDLAGS